MKINNKPLSYLFALIIITVLFIGVNTDARVNNNDQVVTPSAVEDNIAVHMQVAAMDEATSTIAVDLSDVTNYPHYMNAGTMEIAQIRFDYSTETTASTTAKVGVIASSSPSGGNVDVYWFDEISFAADGSESDSRQSKILDYSPSVMKLNLLAGEPASFLTNDSSLWTSDYATTTPIFSPTGFDGTPDVGDLVMRIYDQKGTATLSATVLYRIKR